VDDRTAGAGAWIRGGLVRVCAHLPEGAVDLTGLRVLLIADVMARAAELRGGQVFVSWTSASEQAGWENAAAVLNIHPPASQAGSAADIHVVSGPGDTEDEIAVGKAALPEAALPEAALPESGGPADAGHDPLAIRLALLARPYAEPAELTEEALADARAMLARWRRLVGQWAESPSRPVPGQVMTELRAATDQLDTAAVVTMLSALADQDDVPAGARFETFLFADRVLALDLPSGIGQAG
jgi:hypothetical protein